MLSGKFENCYGLKSFELKEIDFTNSNKAIIYAPNGVMKTSFSNVFSDIEKLKKILWVHYLNNLGKDFSVYFSKVNSFSTQIKKLFESAERQAERWQRVVDVKEPQKSRVLILEKMN